MIPEPRQQFNAAFSPARYQEMLAAIDRQLPGQLEFRVAETPIFVPAALRDKLVQAGQDIIKVLQRSDFKQLTEAAIPLGQRVPNEDAHAEFLTFDFAICRDEHGELEPQLIELQGFPSLYAFQAYLPEAFGHHYPIVNTVSPFLEVADQVAYLTELKEVLVADEDPAHVILLELFPEQQKTRVDFALTKQYFGIEVVSLPDVIKRGRQLFYVKDGREIQVKRIYNRIIFDELTRHPDLHSAFNLLDEVDVKWVGHPNWFFRISKYTLPLIKSKFAPPSYYLQDLATYPPDLENYVLKPLYSFAGAGVRLHITPADLDAITDKHNYLLQRKVTYAPVIQSPDGLVKCEIRLLYTWPPTATYPKLMAGLARLSRGEMIGVDFNKNKDWVGGTTPLFER